MLGAGGWQKRMTTDSRPDYGKNWLHEAIHITGKEWTGLNEVGKEFLAKCICEQYVAGGDEEKGGVHKGFWSIPS